jgi:ABC-type lipoprotein export system ATPase subunit
VNTLTILPGKNRQGQVESFSEITFERGKLYTIVGNTGSGKSRLIKDIEQLVYSDSVTHRKVLLDRLPVQRERRNLLANTLVAHLGQNMRFVLDLCVKDFLQRHAWVRGIDVVDYQAIIRTANRITQEPIDLHQNLSGLSGGQSRALMVSDIAHICVSPIVLIDEIENAGIDKKEALQVLSNKEKLVLVVTHDPHTALMADMRIVLNQGGISKVVQRSNAEQQLFKELENGYRKQQQMQQSMRRGDYLI